MAMAVTVILNPSFYFIPPHATPHLTTQYLTSPHCATPHLTIPHLFTPHHTTLLFFSACRAVFQPIIGKIMEKYQPGAVVLQCGADSLAGNNTTSNTTSDTFGLFVPMHVAHSSNL